jgi:hypothetical protein
MKTLFIELLKKLIDFLYLEKRGHKKYQAISRHFKSNINNFS